MKKRFARTDHRFFLKERRRQCRSEALPQYDFSDAFYQWEGKPL
jgi:hypothetical protein